MSTFHQLWLRNQTVPLFTSRVISQPLSTVHGLTTLWKHLCCRSRTIQPLPSVESCSEENGIWLERRYGSRWLWFGDKNRQNCQLVKEISSFSNQLFKKPSLVPKRRSKKRILNWKTRKKWHMQSVLVRLNSTTWRQTAAMVMTSTSKPWYPLKGETGPYVQYAYARIQSILRKANFTPSTDATYSLSDPESWEIIKLLQDSLVLSNVPLKTMIHPWSQNMLSTWLKPSTNTMHTLVSWMKAQNAKAVLLLATQQQ